MNTHQTSVLSYLNDRGSLFVEWLAKLPGTNQIVGDMCPLAIRFLDEKLRDEMALYEPRCVRYHVLIDMLIEVNLKMRGEFKERLCAQATQFVIGKPAEYRN